MPKMAGAARGSADQPRGAPSPDLLLVLLEVARTGRFILAAQNLGVDHTTVARKITALERIAGGRVLDRTPGGWLLTPLGRRLAAVAEQVSDLLQGLGPDGEPVDRVSGTVRMTATDGFSAYVAAPAVARLLRAHPGLRVEVVTLTRRALTQRSGVDVEVVVGEPQVHRAQAVRLGDYELGMYASRDYLRLRGEPRALADLAEHGLVYFVDAMLQVDDLDAPLRLVPAMAEALTSTNVFVHVEATRVGAGIGFLPCFMADRHADLVRVLPGQVTERLTYWMVLRPEALRSPATAAVADALRRETRRLTPVLLPG
ncbi:MAG: LysR family transcriptional regulator, partial [Actinomycetota bacterium]|nr:LysR family transcriptional regulator [Actinomycetota bacterium]